MPEGSAESINEEWVFLFDVPEVDSYAGAATIGAISF